MSKLDGNPRAQAMVIGALVLVFGVILYMQVLRGSGDAGATGASVPPAGSAAGTAGNAAPGAHSAAAPAKQGAPDSPADNQAGPADQRDGAAGAEGEADPSERGSAATGQPGGQSGLVAGDGLPPALVRAYDHGRTPVLLIYQRGGIEDRRALRAFSSLRRRKHLAVIRVPVAGVSAFSRVTQGLEVSRVPALVVMRPRQTAGEITAAVRYGPLDRVAMRQAIRDVNYTGPEVPAYPAGR